MGWRYRIAHAVTPWAWNSRRSVVILLAVAIVVTTVSVVTGLRPHPLTAIIRLVVGLLLWVLPARRSLRRWDYFHAEPKPAKSLT